MVVDFFLLCNIMFLSAVASSCFCASYVGSARRYTKPFSLYMLLFQFEKNYFFNLLSDKGYVGIFLHLVLLPPLLFSNSIKTSKIYKHCCKMFHYM